MANKFLPFVVARSTPIHIFTTLLSRSKGVNIHTIIDVFNIVLEEGIEEVRAYVKTLEEMGASQVYGAVCEKFSGSRLSIEYYNLFISFKPYLPDFKMHCSDEIKELNLDEFLAYCSVTHELEDFSDTVSLPFAEVISARKEIYSDIQQLTKISSKGVPVSFNDENDFNAFVIMYKLGAIKLPSSAEDVGINIQFVCEDEF